MKTKYNYYLDGKSITKKQFLAAVPDDWEYDVDKFGSYSWGYYNAEALEQRKQ